MSGAVGRGTFGAGMGITFVSGFTQNLHHSLAIRILPHHADLCAHPRGRRGRPGLLPGCGQVSA